MGCGQGAGFEIGASTTGRQHFGSLYIFDVTYSQSNFAEQFEIEDSGTCLDSNDEAVKRQRDAFLGVWNRMPETIKADVAKVTAGFRFSAQLDFNMQRANSAFFGENQIVYNSDNKLFYVAVPCEFDRSFVNSIVNFFSSTSPDLAQCQLMGEGKIVSFFRKISDVVASDPQFEQSYWYENRSCGYIRDCGVPHGHD